MFKGKLLIGCATVSLTIGSVGATASDADSLTQVHAFEIEAQTLEKALIAYSIQSGIQVIAPGELVAGKTITGYNRTESARSALEQILQGSDLTYRVQGDRTVVLLEGSGGAASRIGFNTAADYEKNLAAVEEDTAEEGFTLEEIVVTAQKRSQSINDVAMSIMAMSSESITRRNLIGMEDYLRSVPGVSLMSQGAAFNSIVMRGIAINAEEDGNTSGPVTGVYFGDTPISGLGVFGNSADIKLVDMERVEVLKGPQGTLYGAGAMSGVVRNIPAAPDLTEFSGSVKVGYSNTARLGSGNSDVQAVLNIPLIEDELAVRAVAYRFDNSGYYRNIGALEPVMSGAADAFGGRAILNDNVGVSSYTGGRISALWQPNEHLSIHLNFLHQEIDQDGWGQTDIGLGGHYDQSRLQLREGTVYETSTEPKSNEGFADELTILQATLEYDFGWATLTSATSRVEEDTLWLRDGALFFSPPRPWSQNIFNSGESTTEELRLISQLDGPLQFIVGYYYEDRTAGFLAVNLFGGAPESVVDGLTQIDFPQFRELKHHALFGEVSYDIMDQLTLTVGARGFDQKRQFDSELRFNNTPGTPTSFDANAQDISFKAGLDYKPDEDILMYALWSQGFRLGDARGPALSTGLAECDADNDGFYDEFPTVSTAGGSLDSDTVDNYELGSKVTMMDRRLQVNVAAYQIDWTNIPVTFVACGQGLVLNAGVARTRGLEFDASYYAENGVSVDLAASYVDAELTGSAEQLGGLGQPGDRLPGSPKYTFNVGLQYDFEISGNEAYVRGDYAYIGGFHVDLAQERDELGDYGKLDLNAGIRLDRFDLSLFAHNLTNEDNLTSMSFFFAPRGTRLRPRTVGIRLGYNF